MQVVTIKRGYPGIGSIAVPTTIVRESFHRRAGIREIIDPSGAYKLRTIEIKRNHGESIGFYITQGDGWKRTNGVFVSRVNLGSVVDTNDLLHVGEEIIKVNGEDITNMPLSNVVLLIKKKRNILRLTVKLPTSEAILKTFSTKHKSLSMTVLPSTIQEPTALTGVAVQIESTPEMELKQVAQNNNQVLTTTSPTSAVNTAPTAEPIISDSRSSVASDNSPLSSSPPSLPTSPVPNLLDSPIPSPSLNKSLQLHSPAGSIHSTASCSDDNELTDSLKGLLDFPSMFDSASSMAEEVSCSKSSSSGSPLSSLHTPPSVFSYPLTPPASVSSSDRTISSSFPITQFQTSLSHPHSISPPPTSPTSLPPSQPHTSSPLSTPPTSPPSSQPPTPPSTPPPPLPTSPPPTLVHEPISPIPSEDDEDIFRLNEIESHLHQWLTQYETNGTCMVKQNST